jgi:formate hydrogenlyase subunit 3/multisubunit Na+/H+ antiporter MnhD subunit
MGILMATLGLALAAGGETAALLAGATVFVVHHTLAKAALFLGLGARRDRPGGVLVFPAFVFLSLSLAGLALTGGALGKLWIETAAAELPGPAAAAFAMALPATSVATGLLMARFLWLTRRAPATARGPGWPAPALAVGTLALPWAMALAGHPHPIELGFGLGHVWKTLWPVLLAIALALAIGAAGRGHPGWRRLAVAPGDIGARLLRADPAAMVARLGAVPAPQLRLPALPDAGRADLRLRPLAVYGSIYLALLLSLILLAGVV